MKKIVSILLMMVMLVGMLGSFSVMAADTDITTISVAEKNGFASQAVTVKIDVDKTYGLSAATLKIKYDTALELLYVENGTYFPNMADSAIYGQDLGGVNGEYTYIGYGNGEDSNKIRGTFVKLTFKLPENAKSGDSFPITIEKNGSVLLTGKDTQKPFTFENGGINGISNALACKGAHAFSDYTVVSDKASYTQIAYKYRVCDNCDFAEVVSKEATAIPDIFVYEGVAINHTGKPSGIAPIFKVEVSKLDLLASRLPTMQPNTKLEAGIVVYKNGEYYTEEIFYGDGKTMSLNEQNKLFIKLENESVFAKFEFKAYVRITDTETNDQRYVYTSATYKGSEEISILNVVKGLYLKAYSKEDQAYLNKVLNGLVQ
jgi:hypothetical protein